MRRTLVASAASTLAGGARAPLTVAGPARRDHGRGEGECDDTPWTRPRQGLGASAVIATHDTGRPGFGVAGLTGHAQRDTIVARSLQHLRGG